MSRAIALLDGKIRARAKRAGLVHHTGDTAAACWLPLALVEVMADGRLGFPTAPMFEWRANKAERV
ncbi:MULTISPECIES: hypothetical protein [Paracoccaceae]|uniref:hypothetical protein n=1 Tax=Paracoccaceae TaxID=31989 RepID=UPI002020A4F3|nr:hypothetical protein [Phaeovulum sp. NW3]MCL7465567.1 hypothetical protein [Phaeovulum sp. NW3]